MRRARRAGIKHHHLFQRGDLFDPFRHLVAGEGLFAAQGFIREIGAACFFGQIAVSVIVAREPERVLAALRERDQQKKLNLTEGVSPTAPERFREHGGATWFKGKGPQRHEQDPARKT